MSLLDCWSLVCLESSKGGGCFMVPWLMFGLGLLRCHDSSVGGMTLSNIIAGDGMISKALVRRCMPQIVCSMSLSSWYIQRWLLPFILSLTIMCHPQACELIIVGMFPCYCWQAMVINQPLSAIYWYSIVILYGSLCQSMVVAVIINHHKTIIYHHQPL